MTAALLAECASDAEYYATAIVGVAGFALFGFFLWLVSR